MIYHIFACLPLDKHSKMWYTMARHVNKMLTMPIDVIELGEALAAKYTGGNFSALVRMLIEERAASDRLHDGLAKAEEE